MTISISELRWRPHWLCNPPVSPVSTPAYRRDGCYSNERGVGTTRGQWNVMTVPGFCRWMSFFLFLHPLSLQLMALNTIHMLTIPKIIFPFQTSCRSLDSWMSKRHFNCHKSKIKLVILSADLQLCFSSCSVQNRGVSFDFSLPRTSTSSVSPEDFFFKIYPKSHHFSQAPFPSLLPGANHHFSPGLGYPLPNSTRVIFHSLYNIAARGSFWKVRPSQLSAPNTTKPSSHSVKTKVKVPDNFLNFSPATLSLAHSLWQAGFSRSRHWRQSWSGYILGLNTCGKKWAEVGWGKEREVKTWSSPGCREHFKEVGRIRGLLEVPLVRPK